MAKHRFTFTERYLVWKENGEKCYLCEKPLGLSETTVDHIIPEHLSRQPEALAVALKQYHLPEGFDVNGFGNWLPAHGICNQRKASALVPPTPGFLVLVARLQQQAPAMHQKAQRKLSNSALEELLGRISHAIENDQFSDEQLGVIQQLLGKQDTEDAEVITDVLLRFIDPDRWRRVGMLNDYLAIVSDGSYQGVTPVTEDSDITWQCPNCGSYGPWNGVICLSCGRKSDPND